jgi:hypothetical protein
MGFDVTLDSVKNKYIKDVGRQRMDEFIKHMGTAEGEQDRIEFATMAKGLVGLIEGLPLDKQWVHDLLRCVGVSAIVRGGVEELYRKVDGLLRAADQHEWDKFCDWMWFYTVPDGQHGKNDVFKTIADLKVEERDHVSSLKHISALEEICREFNRQLGWRCAQHAHKEHEKLKRSNSELRSSLDKTQAELAKTKLALANAQTEAVSTSRPDGGLRGLVRTEVGPGGLQEMLRRVQGIHM